MQVRGCRGVRRGDGGRACGVDAAGMDEAQLRAALARERAENERLRLENDVMREAMDVLKSPCPLPLAGVAGRLERTMVVERLRDRWPLKALLEAVGLNRKSYYYCFASMSFQQAHQYFSAVWADGFPRSRHHAVSDVR